MSHVTALGDAGSSSLYRPSKERAVKLIGILLYDGFSLLGAGTLPPPPPDASASWFSCAGEFPAWAFATAGVC